MLENWLTHVFSVSFLKVNRRQLFATDEWDSNRMTFMSAENRPVAIQNMLQECDLPPDVHRWNRSDFYSLCWIHYFQLTESLFHENINDDALIPGHEIYRFFTPIPSPHIHKFDLLFLKTYLILW